MNTASPEVRAPVQVHVHTQMITAEISVYDASYRRVASAVGELRAQLPPGVYEVEAAVGQRRERQFVVLNPGSPQQNVYFQNRETGLASAAPLPGTDTTHEWHRYPAEEWSRKETMPGAANARARLFVFIRTLEPEKYKDKYDRGLRLMDARGRLVCDFATGVARDRDRGWTALTINLPPGGYQMYRGGKGRPARYQAVWLSEGWETQVFIPSQEIPQLGQISYFMARFGTGFYPDNEAYLTSEIVLDGLCRGINLASSTQMQYLLTGKFENPWLGILALHAMRLDPTADHSVEQNVLHNLRNLIGGHPDLRVLDLSADPATTQSFTFPPILYASFKLLRTRASEIPGTLKPRTLASRIFDALVTDSPWLAWHKLPPLKRKAKRIQSVGQAFFEASGSKWLVPGRAISKTASLDLDLSDLFSNPEFPEENPLIADLLRLSETYGFEDPPDAVPYSIDPNPLLLNESASRLSKQLSLPIDKVEDALERFRKNPELLGQPRLMTITEMSVAEATLSRRPLKEDRSLPRSSETGTSTLTASIEAVAQAQISLKRLSDQKIVEPVRVQSWMNGMQAIRGWLEEYQDAVLLVDANAQIVYVSESFEKLAGRRLTELARERISNSYAAIISDLAEMQNNVATLSLPEADSLQTYRVTRLRFIDELTRAPLATVYRMRRVNLPELSLSRQNEIRRIANKIIYYASVMISCDLQERIKCADYIDRELGELNSLMM